MDQDTKQARKYVSKVLQEQLLSSDGSEFKTKDGVQVQSILKSIANSSKYKIESVTGDKTKVATVSITYPDISKEYILAVKAYYDQMANDARIGKGVKSEDENNAILQKYMYENLKDYKLKTNVAKGQIKMITKDKDFIITEIDGDVANALSFGTIYEVEDSIDEIFGDANYQLYYDNGQWFYEEY